MKPQFKRLNKCGLPVLGLIANNSSFFARNHNFGIVLGLF